MAATQLRTEPVQEGTTFTRVSERKKKTEQERLSRQRRTVKLGQMRRTVDQLERFILVARTLKEKDAVWDEIFDENLLQTRCSLIQVAQLIRETYKLQLERTELQHLLTEHMISTATIVNILSERFSDSWEAKVEYYRELVHQHYRPWTLQAAQEELDIAFKEVNAFEWSTDKQSTNLHFLGWRDKQRFDRSRGTFQFEFFKTFYNLDIMKCVNATWDSFTHSKTYLQTIVRHRPVSSFEVLQQLGPNIVIVRSQNRCAGVVGDIHDVLLVCRVRTPRGYTQCVRSIQCPELMRVLSGPSDVWPTTKIWFQWDRLEGEEQGYTFRIGGKLMARDTNYGQNWMIRVFGTVLRIERLGTGRQLVTSE